MQHSTTNLPSVKSTPAAAALPDGQRTTTGARRGPAAHIDLWEALHALSPTALRYWIARQTPDGAAASQSACARRFGVARSTLWRAERQLRARGLWERRLPSGADAAALDRLAYGPLKLALARALTGVAPRTVRGVRALTGLDRLHLYAACRVLRTRRASRCADAHIKDPASAHANPYTESKTDSVSAAKAGKDAPGQYAARLRDRLRAVLDVPAARVDALLSDYADHWDAVESELERYPHVQARFAARGDAVRDAVGVFRSMLNGHIHRRGWYRPDEWTKDEAPQPALKRPPDSPVPAPQPALKRPPVPSDLADAWKRLRAAGASAGAGLLGWHADRQRRVWAVRADSAAGRDAVAAALLALRLDIGAGWNLVWRVEAAAQWWRKPDWQWADVRPYAERRCTDAFARLALRQARAVRLDIETRALDLELPTLGADAQAERAYARFLERLSGRLGALMAAATGAAWRVRLQARPRPGAEYDADGLAAALEALAVRPPYLAIALRRPDVAYRQLFAPRLRSPRRRAYIRDTGRYAFRAIQQDYPLA